MILDGAPALACLLGPAVQDKVRKVEDHCAIVDRAEAIVGHCADSMLPTHVQLQVRPPGASLEQAPCAATPVHRRFHPSPRRESAAPLPAPACLRACL